MEKLKELLNSFTEKDYKIQKVNLHIHTSLSDGRAYDLFEISFAI